jgi:hypothetical protein
LDALSLIAVLSEEAKNEVKAKLGSVEYHVDINKKVYFSGETISQRVYDRVAETLSPEILRQLMRIQ